jgi:hypothetical protein
MDEKNQEVIDDKPIQTEGEGEPSTPKYTEEETIAMTRGWKPKEEWDGDEGDWKPAKVFNEIGELKEKIVSSEKELKKTNKVIQLMKEHHLNVRQSALKEAIETLKSERQAALKEQDFARAEEIRDQIDDVKDRFKKDDVLPAAVEKKIEAELQDPDPEFYAFVNRNPWYKPNGANEMSKKADALGWAYKQEDPNITFPEIIKKVEKDIRKLYPEKFESPRNPVNEGGTRGGGSGGGKAPKLSDEELAVAKNFGMTPEEYAKELQSYKGR